MIEIAPKWYMWAAIYTDRKLWMQTVIWYSFNIYDRQMNQQYNQLWQYEKKHGDNPRHELNQKKTKTS